MGILLSRIFGFYPTETMVHSEANKVALKQLREDLLEAIDVGMNHIKEEILEALHKDMETFWQRKMEGLLSRVEELAVTVREEALEKLATTEKELKGTKSEGLMVMPMPGGTDNEMGELMLLPPPETKELPLNPPPKLEEVAPATEPEKPAIQLPPKSESAPAVGFEDPSREDLPKPKPEAVPAIESKEAALSLPSESKPVSDKVSTKTTACGLEVRGRGRSDMITKTSPKAPGYRGRGRGRICTTPPGTPEVPLPQKQDEVKKSTGITTGSLQGEEAPEGAGSATKSLQGGQMQIPPFLQQHFKSLKARGKDKDTIKK